MGDVVSLRPRRAIVRVLTTCYIAGRRHYPGEIIGVPRTMIESYERHGYVERHDPRNARWPPSAA